MTSRVDRWCARVETSDEDSAPLAFDQDFMPLQTKNAPPVDDTAADDASVAPSAQSDAQLNGRHRHWAFTVFMGNVSNDSSQEDARFLQDTVQRVLDNPNVKYHVSQLEECSEKGTPHVQGYMVLVTPKHPMPTKKMFLPFEPHLEVARLHVKDNIIYCTKEFTKRSAPGGPYDSGRRARWKFSDGEEAKPITFGTPPRDTRPTKTVRDAEPVDEKPKKKSAFQEVDRMLREGMKLWQIEQQYPQYGYVVTMFRPKFMATEYALFRNSIRQKPRRPVEVTVIIGPPGCGKSQAVENAFKVNWEDVYRKTLFDEKWWDDYVGQEVLWLDDFDGSWMTPATLMQVLDEYHARLPTKGSHSYSGWGKVFIVSNFDVNEWWDYNKPTSTCKEKEMDAILSRITAIGKMVYTEAGDYRLFKRRNWKPDVVNPALSYLVDVSWEADPTPYQSPRGGMRQTQFPSS